MQNEVIQFYGVHSDPSWSALDEDKMQEPDSSRAVAER